MHAPGEWLKSTQHPEVRPCDRQNNGPALMSHAYTSSDRAWVQALINAQGNRAEAARRTGLPRSTILYGAHATAIRGTLVENGKRKVRTGTEDDRDAAIAHWKKARDLNVVEMADPVKVKKATLYHNVVAAGTAQDKLNVLSGNPTSLIGAAGSLETVLRMAVGGSRALGDGDTIKGEVVPESHTECE